MGSPNNSNTNSDAESAAANGGNGRDHTFSSNSSPRQPATDADAMDVDDVDAPGADDGSDRGHNGECANTISAITPNTATTRIATGTARSDTRSGRSSHSPDGSTTSVTSSSVASPSTSMLPPTTFAAAKAESASKTVTKSKAELTSAWSNALAQSVSKNPLTADFASTRAPGRRFSSAYVPIASAASIGAAGPPVKEEAASKSPAASASTNPATPASATRRSSVAVMSGASIARSSSSSATQQPSSLSSVGIYTPDGNYAPVPAASAASKTPDLASTAAAPVPGAVAHNPNRRASYQPPSSSASSAPTAGDASKDAHALPSRLPRVPLDRINSYQPVGAPRTHASPGQPNPAIAAAAANSMDAYRASASSAGTAASSSVAASGRRYSLAQVDHRAQQQQPQHRLDGPSFLMGGPKPTPIAPKPDSSHANGNYATPRAHSSSMHPYPNPHTGHSQPPPTNQINPHAYPSPIAAPPAPGPPPVQPFPPPALPANAPHGSSWTWFPPPTHMHPPPAGMQYAFVCGWILMPLAPSSTNTQHAGQPPTRATSPIPPPFRPGCTQSVSPPRGMPPGAGFSEQGRQRTTSMLKQLLLADGSATAATPAPPGVQASGGSPSSLRTLLTTTSAPGAAPGPWRSAPASRAPSPMHGQQYGGYRPGAAATRHAPYPPPSELRAMLLSGHGPSGRRGSSPSIGSTGTTTIKGLLVESSESDKNPASKKAKNQPSGVSSAAASPASGSSLLPLEAPARHVPVQEQEQEQDELDDEMDVE